MTFPNSLGLGVALQDTPLERSKTPSYWGYRGGEYNNTICKPRSHSTSLCAMNAEPLLSGAKPTEVVIATSPTLNSMMNTGLSVSEWLEGL